MAGNDDLNALETLFPERKTTLQEREITVREISFLAGLESWDYADGLYRTLAGLFDAAPDGQVSSTALLKVFGSHAEAVSRLIAASTGLDQAELKAIGDEDGQSLLLTFWQVNQHFFGRRLALLRAASQASETPSA